MKTTAPTKQELENYELTHKHAGNGFVMVEDLDKDYCRVTNYAGSKLDWLIRLAAKDRLTVSRKIKRENGKDVDVGPMPIKQAVLTTLSELRAAIRSGKKKVVNNRVVPL